MKGIVKVAIFFLFVSFAQSLYSQTDIEQATRETDRLGRKEIIEEKLKQPLKEKPAEEKPEEPLIRKEEESFFIKKINLVGCESFSPAVFSSIVEKYENREISLTDLNALTKELEREYLSRGVIAAVFVPEQELKDQAVTLQVVEAKMGELKIKDSKYFNRSRLVYYWKVPPGMLLRYDKISQSIQLMNDNPDRQVKAALFAGKKPGTTDVLLTPYTRFPLHGTASFDREGAVTTGRGRVGYGFRYNNFLGFDDTLIGGYTFGRAFSGTYFYHSLPVDYNGTSILYGYSRSQSQPTKEFSGTGLKSDATNINFSLRRDIYRKDKYLGEVFLGFDAKDKITRLSSGPLNRDRLRMVSLGGSFIRRQPGNTSSFSVEYEQGLSALGASSDDNPLASREAKPVFSKINLDLQHKRALPLNAQASLKFKGQLASRKLTPQEEFGLGGIDSVRGYPASDYQADDAASSSAELLLPSFFIPSSWRIPYEKDSLKNQTTLVTFADYGWGKRRGALTTEKATVNMLSIGAGVRVTLFDQALVRLEWGFPVAANRPLTEGGHSRMHFSVAFQEKLPEEIERIRRMIEEENIKQWAWTLVNNELSTPGSSLGKKLYGYLRLARQNYKDEKLKEAKTLYEKLRDLSMSLYRQSEDYVRNCLQQQKELKEYQKLALTNHREGKIEESKQLWQKIIDEAKPKQLILEF